MYNIYTKVLPLHPKGDNIPPLQFNNGSRLLHFQARKVQSGTNPEGPGKKGWFKPCSRS